MTAVLILVVGIVLLALFNCLAPDKAIAIGIGFDFRAVDEDSPLISDSIMIKCE